MKLFQQLFIAIVLLSAAPVYAEELTVAVGANMQFAFAELQTIFERQSGIVIKPAVASSGTFTSQIENGAPFDVFISGDLDYPGILYKEGFTYDAPKIYAYGSLVLWTMSDIDLAKGINVLNDPAVKKIALANPRVAPYGRQAMNTMRFHKLFAQVEHKFVYGESVSEVSQMVTNRSAEMGFMAKSIVLAPSMKNKGRWIDINRSTYEPMPQGIVILKKAKLKEAKALEKFFFSPQAQKILLRYGFILPPKGINE
jgi:molybdate transport system substrate-binding protein